MSYIKTVEPSEAEGTVKKIYDEFQEKYGDVPTWVKANAIRPDILEGTLTFATSIMFDEHAIDNDTKALIASHVSKVNSCVYWGDPNLAKFMASSGYTEDEARSILEDVDGSDLIDASQKAILHFAEKVTRHAYKITETDIELLRKNGLGDDEIFEVTCIIGLYNMTNRIAGALGLPVDEVDKLFSRAEKGIGR